MSHRFFPSSMLSMMIWKYSIVFVLTLTHPLHHGSSTTICHGFQEGTSYKYDYNTLMLLNNHDRKGKEPVGFGFSSRFDIQNVWQSEKDFLLQVSFDTADGGWFLTRNGDKRHGMDSAKKAHDRDQAKVDPFPLFAHVERTPSGENRVIGFWIHNRETPTRINVKKAIISLIQGKPDSRDLRVKWKIQDNHLHRSFHANDITSESSTNSLLLPQVINVWNVASELDSDHSIVKEANGWQNVTLRSKIYTEAHSSLHSTFYLKLIEEEQVTDSQLSSAKSLRDVGDLLGEDYIEENGLFLEPQKEVCHDCRTLKSLAADYEDFMSGPSTATVPATIAYLKLLERIRVNGPGASKDDIVDLLNHYKKARKEDVLSSVLDVLAGARTENAILSSLEYLKLPSSTDLDTIERFLSSLAASCTTAASSLLDDILNHRIIVEELMRTLEREPKWKSKKLRWTTLLTLASVFKSYKRRLIKRNETDKKSEDLDLTGNIVKLIATDLKSCGDDVECKVACLHALGNLGALSESIAVLEEYALDPSGKRESIAAMKAIRDCLEDREIAFLNNSTLIYQLRILALKIVYDSNHETTSRIIAAEIIAKYLSDSALSEQLLREIPNFGNNEMVTMMWNRALKLINEQPLNTNWLIHSTLFNGSSSAFTRSMGGTDTANATYGVAMELLSKGNLLKESNFDFSVGDQQHQQHILSVGLFARGLQSFAGGSESSNNDESMMAGMALRIMGMQLRPYTFFHGMGELMGHVWSGTASEPTTAFRSNLLLSDHEDATPLMNGFVVRQKVRGVLSLDLSAEIQISMWNRNAHAVVRSKVSALMQGSQTLLTSDLTTSAAQQFAFGGATTIDTTTDTDFASSPFKMCVKMTQPQFMLRHNTRKYEQVDSTTATRRIHKRNFLFPARSFALHPKIQEVCETF